MTSSLPIIHGAAPFWDFMLVLAPSRSSNSHNPEYLERRVPLRRRWSQKDAQHRVDVYTPSEEPPMEATEDRLAFMSGYAFSNGELIGWTSQAADRMCEPGAPPASSPMGNYVWICGAKDHSERLQLTIGADPLGLSQIFVASNRDVVVVSNRYQLACLAVGWLGATPYLRIPPLATAMYADSVIGLQCSTHQMSISGVEMLPAGVGLRIGPAGVRHWEAWDDSSRDDRYEVAIHRGAEELLRNVSSVLDTRHRSSTVLNLTGGADSRLILAAVRALGRQDEVLVDTHRLSDEFDFRIALALAERLGLAHRSGHLGSIPDISPTQYSDIWRSHLFGLYHDISLARNQVSAAGDDSIRLAGGGGELYRGYFQKMVPHQILDLEGEAGVRAFIDYLAGLNGWTLLHTVPPRDTLGLIARELIGFDGAPLRAKLDSWYRAFRNRFHFGATASTNAHFGTLAVTPLLSPSLLAAARSLPPHQRESGKVIHDVTMALDPGLVTFPLSDDEQLRRDPVESHDLGVDQEKALRRWTGAQQRLRATSGLRPTSPEAWKRAMRFLVADALERLEEDGPPEFRFCHASEFTQRLSWLERNRNTAFSWWASRLSAMADLATLTTRPG